MSAEVISALGLDTHHLINKVVLIEEQQSSDACFLISSIISKEIQRQSQILLITFHNNFGHFQNIGVKLGYNLHALREKNEIRVIEVMKILLQNIQSETSIVDFLTNCNNSNKIKILTDNVKDCIKLFDDSKPILIVFDDLSHLSDLRIPLKDILQFFDCIRALQYEDKNINIVVNIHVSSEIDKLLSNNLFYKSDSFIKLIALKTGNSSGVSGKFELCKRKLDLNDSNCINDFDLYHYKLFDRQIKVFSPGEQI